jgi:hypothetical protein
MNFFVWIAIVIGPADRRRPLQFRRRPAAGRTSPFADVGVGARERQNRDGNARAETAG